MEKLFQREAPRGPKTDKPQTQRHIRVIDTNQGGRKDMKEKRGVFYSARMRARERETWEGHGRRDREREGGLRSI